MARSLQRRFREVLADDSEVQLRLQPEPVKPPGGEDVLAAIAKLQSARGNYVRIDHLREELGHTQPASYAALDKAVIGLADEGKISLAGYDGPTETASGQSRAVARNGVDPDRDLVYDGRRQGYVGVALKREGGESASVQRVQMPPIEETIAERDRMLGVMAAYGGGDLTRAELPTDVHTYPGRIVQATARIDELQLLQQEPEVIGKAELRRAVSGHELIEQEHSADRDPATQWTLQQYSTNPGGEPRFVLQRQDESGQLRTVSGSREELDSVIAEHGLKPLELPPVTGGSYYREAIRSVELAPEIRREEGVGVSV